MRKLVAGTILVLGMYGVLTLVARAYEVLVELYPDYSECEEMVPNTPPEVAQAIIECDRRAEAEYLAALETALETATGVQALIWDQARTIQMLKNLHGKQYALADTWSCEIKHRKYSDSDGEIADSGFGGGKYSHFIVETGNVNRIIGGPFQAPSDVVFENLGGGNDLVLWATFPELGELTYVLFHLEEFGHEKESYIAMTTAAVFFGLCAKS